MPRGEEPAPRLRDCTPLMLSITREAFFHRKRMTTRSALLIGTGLTLSQADPPNLVDAALKGHGESPRRNAQHGMWSGAKDEQHKRLDHRARSAPK